MRRASAGAGSKSEKRSLACRMFRFFGPAGTGSWHGWSLVGITDAIVVEFFQPVDHEFDELAILCPDVMMSVMPMEFDFSPYVCSPHMGKKGTGKKEKDE